MVQNQYSRFKFLAKLAFEILNQRNLTTKHAQNLHHNFEVARSKVFPSEGLSCFTMESHYQQEYLRCSYFQPLHSDLSYESHDDETNSVQECFNKSIFRQPEDETAGSPPNVGRANPIGMDEDDDDSCCHDQEFYNVITPYPYSPCQEELEDRQHLVSEIPQLATLSSVGGGDIVDYSFYFEMNLEIQPREIVDCEIAHSYSTQTGSCGTELREVLSPAQISDTDSMGDGN